MNVILKKIFNGRKRRDLKVILEGEVKAIRFNGLKLPLFSVSQICNLLQIQIPQKYIGFKEYYLSETPLFDVLENKELLCSKIIASKPLSKEKVEKIKDNAGKFKSFYYQAFGLQHTDEELLEMYIQWRYTFKPLFGVSHHYYFSFEFYKKTIEEAAAYLNKKDKQRIWRASTVHSYADYLRDKVLFNQTFKKHVKREFLSMKDATFEEFQIFISNHPAFFGKPRGGTMGIDSGYMTAKENLEAQFEELKAEDFIVEQIQKQHHVLAEFNSDSLNTIRVNTLLTLDNEPIIMHANLKCGRKGRPMDNLSNGGMAVTIDIETGVICTSAVDTYNYRYEIHPDSKKKFEGTQIPNWDKLVAVCKESAMKMPYIRTIGWDVAVDEDGEIELIEGNTRASVLLMQKPDQIGRKYLYEKYIGLFENSNWKEELLAQDPPVLPKLPKNDS